MPVLELNHIRKRFGDLEVLQDISLSVEKGEVVAIIGPSGSGKSTLLRCATLLERIDSGEVCFDGHYAARTGDDGAAVYADKAELKQIRNYFGLVFQQFNLFPHYSVLKNVMDAPICVQKRERAEVEVSARKTLEKMGLDYLDQMIIHSPQPWNQFRVEKRYSEENKAVWRALEDAQSEGKVRVIGVSNFLRDDLENLLSDCRVKPMVNQILLHISNTDLALLDYCREQGIQVEAYSPIAHGEALKNPAIAEMAKKYGVTAAQLCIRYVIELGAVALPKTANPEHMASNAAVDFTISSEDMETLKHTDRIADYGEFNIFPVFSGKPLA